MTFDYDGQGRLAALHDTLDTPAHNRDINITYNVEGCIETITDYTGRQVIYDYYDGIEPGGNLGDLKSVTSPVVTGTPNGNDFPLGKTTVYTYSAGFADERLNHNLLTITDPKGQTFLTNTYAATLNPSDVVFDHVTTQIWGDPGDRLDAVYVSVTPSAANNFAVVMAIVNDRVGNVEELLYDAEHRCVIRREYTGRAPNPDAPTTPNANRPTDKLRPEDPDLFETRYKWSGDSLLTRVIYPNQNEVQRAYDELNPNPRFRVDLLQITRLPGPHGGDQAHIVESFEYDTDFGGCCGTNFVTRHVDARGNETLYEYDAAGNHTHTQYRIPSIVEDWEYNVFGQVTAHVLPGNGNGHLRRDEFTYYDVGPMRGYRKDRIVDATGFALTTTIAYNPRGRSRR